MNTNTATLLNFGVATLLALVAAALLLIESARDEKRGTERISWLDTLAKSLKENHNANRLFVIFEVVFDLVLAAESLQKNAVGLLEYDISLTAIVAAVMALLCTVVDIVLFYMYREEIESVRTMRSTEPLWETVRAHTKEARSYMESDRDKKERAAIRSDRYLFRCLIYPAYNAAFIVALILSDLADILLLSQSAVVMQFETKDLAALRLSTVKRPYLRDLHWHG